LQTRTRPAHTSEPTAIFAGNANAVSLGRSLTPSLSLQQPCLDGFKCSLGTRAIGTAGLRHAGPTAAALPTQRFGTFADEVRRVVARREIGCDADHEPSLALRGHADNGNDAGSDLPLTLIDETFEVFDVDAGDRAGQ